MKDSDRERINLSKAEKIYQKVGGCQNLILHAALVQQLVDIIREMYKVIETAGPLQTFCGCRNPDCKGEWGTGCYDCHSGKYHPVLKKVEL